MKSVPHSVILEIKTRTNYANPIKKTVLQS